MVKEHMDKFKCPKCRSKNFRIFLNKEGKIAEIKCSKCDEIVWKPKEKKQEEEHGRSEVDTGEGKGKDKATKQADADGNRSQATQAD